MITTYNYRSTSDNNKSIRIGNSHSLAMTSHFLLFVILKRIEILM